MTAPVPIHAGLAAFHSMRGWRGVLVRGRSGAGKSDLTLRLIALGWRLVADDRVVLWTSAGRLWGRSAPGLEGLMEVRAVGVTPWKSLAFTGIDMVVDCAAPRADLDRIPLEDTVDLCGVAVPRLLVNPFEISAAHKIQAYCVSVRL